MLCQTNEQFLREICIFVQRMKTDTDYTQRLQSILQQKLPGQESQYKMAPQIRLENKHNFYRNAAVMVLLYPYYGDWHFVLMKRPEYKGAHSNQVSLPGGIHEEHDPDQQATALRETKEELGIDDSKINVLGALSKLHIPVSGIKVSPFVGIYPENPEFEPDPVEVSYLIEVPLADLLNPDKVRENTRIISGKPVKVPYFQLKGEQVWGATAMILSEFQHLIRKLGGVDLQ
jgi:8-oxo-dGTP pyrophosphatase MutT (NUDIX family)